MEKKKIIIIMISYVLFLSGCSNNKESKKETINEYEIVSVNQYVQNKTNNFGGIIDTDIYYTFIYIDNENRLEQVDKFEKRPHTDIRIGNSNKYVIKENTYEKYSKILYLTKETLNNIKLERRN